MEILIPDNSEPTCDFCCVGLVPLWEYPCDSFTVSVPELGVNYLSNASWAACEECSGFIDSGSWNDLIVRGALTHPAVLNGTVPFTFALTYCEKAFGKFREFRFGEKVKFSG